VIFEEDDEEFEGYLFAGQDDDTKEEVLLNDVDDDSGLILDVFDLYDAVYANMPEDTHMLELVENCPECNAKKFEFEPPGFCCCSGKIKLSTPDTPPELMRLWSSSDADARHFRVNSRFFNGHFSFTSMYCQLDRITTNMRTAEVYTFRAHGQIYHNLRSFGRDGTERRHLELYFYDDNPSLEYRFHKCRQKCKEMDKEVIRKLVDIMRDNPYSEHLRSFGQNENLDDYHVELNLDQRLDQRTYNTPLTSKDAADI